MSLMDFVVSPSGYGRRLFRRSYVVPMRWIVIYEHEIPGGALTQVLLNYPDHGHHGNLPLQEKITTVEPGIEPRTS
jgi:hypothetical protein